MWVKVQATYKNQHDRDAVRDEILSNGFITGREVEIVRKDGQTVWVSFDARAQRDHEGRIIRFDGVIINISPRKEAQQKLEKANRQIVTINENLEKRVKKELRKRQRQQQLLIQKSKLESLGELAAGIAHEINQPLGVLALALENLFEKAVSNNISAEYIESKRVSVFKKIEQIRFIINHIRQFSRDQQTVIFTKVDVNEAVQNTLSMIKAQYETHGIRLRVDLQTSPGFTVGNLIKLEQVLMNLLSNAKYAVDRKKAMYDDFEYEKTIGIRTRYDENYIILEVEDNGTGIEARAMKKLFEPFFTTKEEGVGTGLGLSIVYGIIREMNGEIRVRSKKGEYTVVTVKLPRFGGK